MISPQEVKAMIENAMPDAQIDVQSPDGEHFDVTVVSSQFAGKRLVQQHQLVYRAVKEAMSNDSIHAFALKTYTPEDWQATAAS
jgi:acid stress-induced BolA-like protein IbaG/YrbA